MSCTATLRQSGGSVILSIPKAIAESMAVGTGCHTLMAKRILAGIALDHYLPIVVGADQVNRPKPAPDTFLLVAEKLNVKPEHCLVFEDADAGLQAAAAAGMATVDVRTLWSAPSLQL